MVTTKQPGTNGRTFTYHAGSVDLIPFLEREVYSRLDSKTIFSHPAHEWREELTDKIKGGCPWHDSSSGTAFYVNTQNHLWRCPACGIGGGPIQYRWCLRGEVGSPRGADFLSVVKELCALAGVPFPERELSPEEQRRAQRREARRAILEAVESHCHVLLLAPTGDAARAYLQTRGFNQEAILDLRLGLYPTRSELKRVLRERGFADDDVRGSAVVFRRMEQYIVFPWHDDRGVPLTLYGTWPARTPPDDKPKKMALSNPTDDSKVEEKTKRAALYLDRALRAAHKHVVLVEGVTDAAVAQVHGDLRVVACVAAELSHAQVETFLRRGVKSVTIALDPDSAGDAGIGSCIRQLRAAGIAAYVAPLLPDGLDPDDFILTKGIDAWRAHIKNGVHAFRWQAQFILSEQGKPECDADVEAIILAAGAYATKQPTTAHEELARYFWPAIATAVGADPAALAARFAGATAGASTEQPSDSKTDSKANSTEADSTEGSSNEPWPQPQAIPVDLLPVAPFDLELLPESFRAYVNDIAERMQCPPDYPAVAIMIVLAGVVGTKLGIRPKKQDDWHVVPNLWGAAVGRPGVMKTPALRGPLTQLQRLQAEAAKAFGKEMDAYELAMEVYETMKKKRKDAIKEAALSGGDAAQAARDNDPGEKPIEPTPRRYLVNDSTVEKLGGLLNSNTNGLTQFRDEFVGLFKGLDKDGQEGARAFYLEAWDGGGAFTYDRIARGTLHIPHVTLSLLGGIQPGKLLDYLRGAIQGAGDDDGLIQRLQLLVYPDVRRNWKNVDRWPETTARQRVWAVVERLNKLSNDPQTEEGSVISALPGVQHDKDADRYFLRFTEDAQEIFDAWRTVLEHRVRSSEEHHAIESHLLKYRSLVPSLALLIHLADDTGGAVGATALQRAIGWSVYLETHMRRVYALGIDAAGLAGKMLSKHILKGDIKDNFKAREIYRKCWAGLADPQAVNQALDLLVELHWLREELQETGGRKTYHYRINPRIVVKTAQPPPDKTDKREEEGRFGASVSSVNEGAGAFSSETDPEADVEENL